MKTVQSEAAVLRVHEAWEKARGLRVPNREYA